MKKSLLLPLVGTVMSSIPLVANPVGFECVSGEAVVSIADSATLQVTTGEQAVINWDLFSIQEHETTRFVMPGIDSSVLNRVMGGEASEILGRLEANGRVYLINPKGVLVGEGASVDTASFIASSFDLLNGEYVAGDGAPVINLGRINANEVRLIGSEVVNAGSIEALALEERSGRIFLTAEYGKIENAGSLSAPSGEVGLMAEMIHLPETARIDVSGEVGGKIDIGGKSIDDLLACAVIVEQGAELHADSLKGDGGQAHILSSLLTDFSGVITARSFEQGDGGFVEISSLNGLRVDSHPDLRSTDGNDGLLVLDPGSVTIRSGGNQAPSGTMDSFTDGWINEQLTTGSLLISTANSTDGKNLTLTIDNSMGDVAISWSTPNMLTLIGGANIVVESGTKIQNTSTKNANILELIGGGSSLSPLTPQPAAVYICDSIIETNAGNVVIIGAGAGQVNSELAGGVYVEAITAPAGITTVSGTITVVGSASGIDSTASGVLITGSSTTNNASISTQNGAVSVIGNGNSGGLANTVQCGVHLTGFSTLETIGSGSIVVKGVSNASEYSPNSDGICIEEGGKILSTGTGSIDLHGTANQGSQYGIRVTGEGSTISSQAGVMTLVGDTQGAATNSIGVLDAGVIDAEGGLNLTTQYDLSIIGSATASAPSIIRVHNEDATFAIGRDLTLSGGVSSQAHAQIGYDGTAASGSMQFTSVKRNVILNSNSSESYAFIGHGNLSAATLSGDIVFQEIQGDLSLTSYATPGSYGQVQIGHVDGRAGSSTLGGNIQVNLNGNCVLKSGDGAASYARVGHGGQSGGTTTYAPGDLLLSCGQDCKLDSHLPGRAEVVAGNGAVTIVVDALYPTPPEKGIGAFITDIDSLVSATDECKIYTSQRGSNKIPEGKLLNGQAYQPGFLYEDTPTEQWGVYYPNGSYGGASYKIYYKDDGDSAELVVNLEPAQVLVPISVISEDATRREQKRNRTKAVTFVEADGSASASSQLFE